MPVRIKTPALLLTAEDCLLLDAMLTIAVRDLKRLPERAAQIVESINRTAQEFPVNPVVKAGFETTFDAPGFGTRSSEASETLSSQDVARMTGVSEQYVCRLARESVLKGTKSGRRGAWQLNRSSVDLWAAQRSTTKAA